jgi:glucan phosphoethanolaminetransferase (alkaline phosphatase superfamily)
MQQTRLESLVEVSLNVFIGYWISFAVWPFVAHLHDLPYSISQSFSITAIFTVTSVMRSYVIRRWFNNGLHMVAVAFAKKLTKVFQ